MKSKPDGFSRPCISSVLSNTVVKTVISQINTTQFIFTEADFEHWKLESQREVSARVSVTRIGGTPSSVGNRIFYQV